MAFVNGKTDNEFYPNDKVTREEFAKLLVCMARLETAHTQTTILQM